MRKRLLMQASTAMVFFLMIMPTSTLILVARGPTAQGTGVQTKKAAILAAFC